MVDLIKYCYFVRSDIKMEIRKKYIKPSIKKIELDNSISLVMMTIPDHPGPRGGTKDDPTSDPFESPFGEKPFG